MISAGLAIQPAISSLAEAEAAVRAPVVGCVPAGALGIDLEPAPGVTQADWARPALILAGAALVGLAMGGTWVWLG